jgi:hypothetical protein
LHRQIAASRDRIGAGRCGQTQGVRQTLLLLRWRRVLRMTRNDHSITIAASALALALASSPASAEGAGYACNVPRALLCENCASSIAITLTKAGACRITFTPGPGRPEAASAPLSLNFNVEVARPAAAYPGRRRVAFARHVSHALSPATHGRCFVFSGSQYCE